MRAASLRLLMIGCLVLLWPNCPGARSSRLWGEAFSRTAAETTAPLAIVVSRSNPVDAVSFADLKRIFLGNRTYWPNGRRITILMREPCDPERNFVLHGICGMSEEQFKTHFLHGLYTGEILVSPKILDASAGVKKFIFNVPGAIGYLPLDELDDSVKVLRIDERLPGEKGYRLRFSLQTDN